MKQPWMKVAAIVVIAPMVSVLIVGCGPEQPEYDTCRQASPQQPHQWSPWEEDSIQQPTPVQPQKGDAQKGDDASGPRHWRHRR